MWGKISRPLFLTLGYVSLGLGIIGLLLPVLPTTPFILLAAFAFSKSSEKLHGWLLNHRLYGPLITNWQRHGVIRPPGQVDLRLAHRHPRGALDLSLKRAGLRESPALCDMRVRGLLHHHAARRDSRGERVRGEGGTDDKE